MFTKLVSRRMPSKMNGFAPSLTQLSMRHKGGFTPSDMPIIKQKWEAALSVGKICESMKNVAAGALPGAERHLANARPFASVALPLFELEEQPKGIQKVLHMIIGTERGMCGAISSNTIRRASEFLEKYPKLDHTAVVYGTRSSGVTETLFGDRLLFAAAEVKTRFPTFEFCVQLAEKILNETEWDMMILYYNEYENLIRLHLKDDRRIYKSELAEAVAQVQFPLYEIEGDDGNIVESLIEWKLASQLYLFLAENFASENASRLQSMDGASKNCNEMCQEYEKVYQDLRKSKITNELIILATAAKLAIGGAKK